MVLHYWEDYRLKLLNQLKSIQGTVFSGDGRFDSMGHSAKFGTYTIFSCDLMKIVHFDLQVSVPPSVILIASMFLVKIK